ncbi:hypothetical protein NLI96_g2321 [Meripilus lineatus]|uniref:Zinc/iron permease n=1 Tax=Meripilus lineatus TaxID=2056292 RepID=A0AAD5YK30_9APHY|nr:hypothetical protein NLI96_g2321 [Physisporinus lineatus]
MPPGLTSATRGWEKSTAGIEDAGNTVDSFLSRVWVMTILFSVSLLASSFPTLSKRISYLRIPRILFFLGKHFGTGVILSTSFVHLLPDAFRNLDHPLVKERWQVGRWTGLIILGSLLTIFLIEYISTAYVDRLQSYSSPSPTPPTSSTSSRTPSVIQLISTDHEDVPHCDEPESIDAEEHSPLMTTDADPRRPTYGSTHDSQINPHTHPHQRRPQLHRSHSSYRPSTLTPLTPHHPDSAEETHSGKGPARRGSLVNLNLAQSDEESDKDKGGDDVVGKHLHSHSHHGDGAPGVPTNSDRGHTHSHTNGSGNNHSHGHHHEGHGHHHLGMEDWDPDAKHHEGEGEEVRVGHRRQVVGILMLQLGIMIHSLVIGLTLAIASGPEFTSLLTAIIFHQLFEGLSLGIRIAALPSSTPEGGFVCLPEPILKPVLAFTFAITTPIGIALGLISFGGGRSAGAQLKLTQGLMAAISAGMLIYAACVEMLAGDFVMDPLLWRSSVKRQVLALLSVFLGAGCMAIIGYVSRSSFERIAAVLIGFSRADRHG